MWRRIFNKFNSAEFREYNDEVYYMPRSRGGISRYNLGAYMYDAYMSRANASVIFVLMQLLFDVTKRSLNRTFNE